MSAVTKKERRVRVRGLPAILQDMTNRAHEAEKSEAEGASIHYCLGMLEDIEMKCDLVLCRIRDLQKEVAEDDET